MDYQNPLSPPPTLTHQQPSIASSSSSSSSPSTSPYSSTPSPPGSTTIPPPVSSSTPTAIIVTSTSSTTTSKDEPVDPHQASTSNPVVGLTDKTEDNQGLISNSNKSKSKKSHRTMKSTTEITQQAAIAAIFPPFSSSTSSLSSSTSSSSSTTSCSSSCSLEVPIVQSSPTSPSSSSSPSTPLDSTCRLVDVKEIANTYRNDLKDWIDQSRARPRLVGFLANKDASAITYARWTQRSCEDIGIKFELRQVEREDLEEGIIEANEDRRVDGIMVYYPVFGGGHDQYIQNCVSPFKDVEGLCHTFRFNMYHNIRFIDVQKKSIIPCTPLAIVKILDFLGVYNHDFDYGDQLNGKVITVINRSEVVGRPLAALLANDGAKTFSVDLDGILQFHRGPGKQKHRVTSTDKTLEDVLPLSDVVVAGVPDKKFKVPTKLLKPGVVAINFSTDKNFVESVKEKASVFVPAIGKMTIVMLQRNLMRLYDYRRDAPFRFRFS